MFKKQNYFYLHLTRPIRVETSIVIQAPPHKKAPLGATRIQYYNLIQKDIWSSPAAHVVFVLGWLQRFNSAGVGAYIRCCFISTNRAISPEWFYTNHKVLSLWFSIGNRWKYL